MKNFSDVRASYFKFWTNFLSACDHGRYIVSPRTCPFTFKHITTDSNLKMSLKPIYLKNWPYKRKSRKKIDIIIRAYEIFSLSDFVIKSSCVHISYFRVKAEKAEMIERIRYDFEIPPPKGDPIFHAHTSCDFENCADIEGFRYNVCNGIKSRFQHLRIPTAHMNLISALTGLVADHTSYNILCELIRKIKNIDLPCAECNSLFNSIKNDKKNFISLHWYKC